MKFDMSGGAAVLEAVARDRAARAAGAAWSRSSARPRTCPAGTPTSPGDILRAKTGTTIEVINTDAEGRLVLADCLAHALDCGAERLVDIATLTGGDRRDASASTYAGLFGTDDDWCAAIAAAGDVTGELVWRLPLHAEYAKAIEGRYADIANAVENRKAGSITAAEFLKRFAGDVPWAHLDIAGVAWDHGREYAAKGGNGFGVRLFVELAASQSQSPTA